jgi:hypothetical protein
MHVQHKLGPKSYKVSNFKPSARKVLHKINQELIKEGIVEKDKSNSFWKNARKEKKRLCRQ